MKKISLFCSALAVAAFALVGCNGNNQNNPSNPGGGEQGGDEPVIVEDGFYVIGEATVATDFKAENAAIELMGQGFNEADKTNRKGMYEKYIALEGGKEFELVLYEAGNETHYGADLKEGEVETDVAPATVLKGQLEKDKKMKVEKNGFYHIILDLNVNEDLPDGAQIIVVPCEWGVRGAMNGWAYTAMNASEFNKETMTFTLKNVLVKQDGAFKFAHGNCWKYNLDKQGKVKAENSLGTTASENGVEECTKATKNKNGGKDYGIKSGYYDITLVWSLKAGDVGESFVAEAVKTADYNFDPSTLVVSLIGAAVGGWGDADDVDFTYASEAGGVYSFVIENQKIAADQFKVRLDHAWSTAYGWNDLVIEGDVDNFENAGPNDYNVLCKSEKTYKKITLSFTVENKSIKDPKLKFEL